MYAHGENSAVEKLYWTSRSCSRESSLSHMPLGPNDPRKGYRVLVLDPKNTSAVLDANTAPNVASTPFTAGSVKVPKYIFARRVLYFSVAATKCHVPRTGR